MIMRACIHRRHLWLLAPLGMLFVALAIWGFNKRENTPDKPGFVFKPTSAFNSRACGPICLRIAAARLGKALDITDLIDACELTDKGASMFRLKQVAEMRGLRAEGVKLSWAKLVKMNTPVIIYLNNNHFCCVDPRERNPGNHKEVRMYCPGTASEWIGPNDLNAYWRGESLVIRRKETQVAENTPRLEFNTILLDFGSIEPCESLTARYPFRNTGRAPLMINRIKKSCGCTSATASKSIINPGETGEITLLLSAQGRTGYQTLSMYVESNDPKTTVTELQYTGFINEKVHISKNILDFGDVYPGQIVSQDIEVTERDGKNNLIIEGIDIKYEQIKKKEHIPITDIDYNPVGKIREKIELTWPARRSIESIDNTPLKYRITVKLTVPVKEPYGPIDGSMGLATKERGYPDIFIPVTMNVVNDIYMEPNNINVGVLMPNEQAVKKIVFKRRSGKPVKIVKSSCEVASEATGIAADIEQIKEEAEQPVLQLRVRRLDDQKRNQLIKGKLKYVFDTGEEMQCEWKGFCK